MNKKRIVIITGCSGSGKSTAIAVFEDAGFYCVDNMPVALLPQFLDLPGISSHKKNGYAFVMDLREKEFLQRYPEIFDSLEKKGYQFEILFLEANDEKLLQRYSQTRRQHPLAPRGRLLEGIRNEKKRLSPLRQSSDKVIDTSLLNVHELKAVLKNAAIHSISRVSMGINVISFGFKYGLPHDADLLMDVRFLKNPYFVPELKELDGKSKPIQDYVLSHDETIAFLSQYLKLLNYLIPLYEKEGKTYLTIAIGCTGGRHRSVVVATSIYEHLKSQDKQVKLTHRDIRHAS